MLKKKFIYTFAVLIIVGVLIFIYVKQSNTFTSFQTTKKPPFTITFKKNETDFLNKVNIKAIVKYQGEKRIRVFYDKQVNIDNITIKKGESIPPSREVHDAKAYVTYLTSNNELLFFVDQKLGSGDYLIKGHIQFKSDSKKYSIPFKVLVSV